jgi:DNA-binding response OmpR family regulator
MAKILVVEDDAELSFTIENWLLLEEHVVETVADGNEAVERLKYYKYDLLVLDWQLPGLDGIEILNRYRSSGGAIPVIMLTGKDAIEDKEVGLDAGADDYLTKPFHVKELSARIRALLRRPAAMPANVLVAGDLRIDSAAHKVFRGQDEIHLHPKEFSLIEFLVKHPGRVFSPESLIDHIWSSYSDTSPTNIRAYVAKLRAKIDVEGKPSVIDTVHGVGYKYEQPKD